MIPKEEFTQLSAGNIIGYYLRSIDLPKNPHQIWRGRVVNIDILARSVLVVVLDKGFEGETETVDWEQIVTIEIRVPGRR